VGLYLISDETTLNPIYALNHVTVISQKGQTGRKEREVTNWWYYVSIDMSQAVWYIYFLELDARPTCYHKHSHSESPKNRRWLSEAARVSTARTQYVLGCHGDACLYVLWSSEDIGMSPFHTHWRQWRLQGAIKAWQSACTWYFDVSFRNAIWNWRGRGAVQYLGCLVRRLHKQRGTNFKSNTTVYV
jgi:hypothetical protein